MNDSNEGTNSGNITFHYHGLPDDKRLPSLINSKGVASALSVFLKGVRSFLEVREVKFVSLVREYHIYRNSSFHSFVARGGKFLLNMYSGLIL